MPSWLVWLWNAIFGGAKQSSTDQELGRAQQSNADLVAAQKESQDASQIDQHVDSETTDQIAADLASGMQRAPDSGGIADGSVSPSRPRNTRDNPT